MLRSLPLLGIFCLAQQPTSVLLNNGVMMPKVCIGVDHLNSVAETKANVLLALDGGARRFFTSNINGFLAGVGQAVRATSVPRSEIFIMGTTYDKSCSGFNDCYNQTTTIIKSNLAQLQLDFVDMLMEDEQLPPDCNSLQGYWKAFEDSYARKEARSIAISNANPSQVDCIMNMKGTIPALNQVSFSIGYPNSMIAYNLKNNVGTDCFHALGVRHETLTDKDVVAIGQKYQKSPAQIAFRFVIQSNVTFQTTSNSKSDVEADVNLFDFTLSASEMQLLQNKRY